MLEGAQPQGEPVGNDTTSALSVSLAHLYIAYKMENVSRITDPASRYLPWRKGKRLVPPQRYPPFTLKCPSYGPIAPKCLRRRLLMPLNLKGEASPEA